MSITINISLNPNSIKASWRLLGILSMKLNHMRKYCLLTARCKKVLHLLFIRRIKYGMQIDQKAQRKPNDHRLPTQQQVYQLRRQNHAGSTHQQSIRSVFRLLYCLTVCEFHQSTSTQLPQVNQKH